HAQPRSLPQMSLHASTPATLTRPPAPYTTLFRSELAQTAMVVGAEDTRAQDPNTVDFTAGKLGTMPPETLVLERGEEGGQRANADRKSTRLHASHDSISYGACCLRKKRREGARQR